MDLVEDIEREREREREREHLCKKHIHNPFCSFQHAHTGHLEE
jgi:hypothetical protein